MGGWAGNAHPTTRSASALTSVGPKGMKLSGDTADGSPRAEAHNVTVCPAVDRFNLVASPISSPSLHIRQYRHAINQTASGWEHDVYDLARHEKAYVWVVTSVTAP